MGAWFRRDHGVRNRLRAAAVASILNGFVKDQVTVKLLGGDLDIFWDRQADLVYMTGPAQVVFDGEITLPWEDSCN